MAFGPWKQVLARSVVLAFAVVFVTLMATNYSAVSLHSKHLVSAAESDLALCHLAKTEKSDAMRLLCHSAEHTVELHTVANDLIEALKLSFTPRFMVREFNIFMIIMPPLALLAVVVVLTNRCLRFRT